MKRSASSMTVLAAVLALAGCGGSSSETQSTQTTTATASETTTTSTSPAQESVVRIVVVGGVPKGGIVRKTVNEGDHVVVVVKSDVADEVHVHGYDLKGDVAAGGTARIAFVAKTPGRFEIELENRGLQIGDLTVE